MEKLLPFFWLRGEDKKTIADAVRKMHEYGIEAFIVESRIHEDFCGENWFEEMDTVIKTATEENMKVWLLDDKQYPTGRANNKLKEIYPDKNAWRLRLERTDICGPLKHAKIVLRADLEAGDSIMGCYLANRGPEPEQICPESVRDISADVEENLLFLDIPSGEQTVYTIVKTHSCSHLPYYVDMLNPASVKVLIDEVYEKHYDRYAPYFGSTFAGFFSDEPCFENGDYGFTPSPSFYESTVGRFGVAYPWSDEVFDLMGTSIKSLLSLWLDMGEETADIRVAYMNAITSLYARNFTGQISRWCHDHGVCYMGHIVEDMGAHLHLGSSSGHYFRSMYGADLAGIDVVLHQIKPFEGRYKHYAPIAGGYADPEFFDYTLAKLAYSEARNDPCKAGNACCEIFGAYGWGESTEEMLYLANHMLVRGINHFVPHAFFHTEGFRDCPPHFLVNADIPVNESQKKLFEYMTKMCCLLSEGNSEVNTVVWYNAEAEWSGTGHTSINRIAQMLTESQTDFCFADTDKLSGAHITDHGFEIGGHFYNRLIIPTYNRIPEKVSDVLRRFEQFAEYSDGKGVPPNSIHGLRVYRYEKNGECYEMIFNESTETVYYDNPNGFRYALDYLNQTYHAVGNSIGLAGGEAFLLRNVSAGLFCTDGFAECGSIDRFDIEIKCFEHGAEFTPYRKSADTSFDINNRNEMPSFFGTVRYSFDLDFSACDGLKLEYNADNCKIRIGDETFVGVSGTVWCMPKTKGKCTKHVTVDLLNSRAYKSRELLSTFDALRPCLLRRVVLIKLLTQGDD